MHGLYCSSPGKRACGDGAQSTLGRGPDEALLAPRQRPAKELYVNVNGRGARVSYHEPETCLEIRATLFFSVGELELLQGPERRTCHRKCQRVDFV